MSAPAQPALRIVIANPPPLAPVDIPPLEDFLFDPDDLDAESCPPDFVVARGDREAWIYDHGDIVDLVFVRTA